MEYRHLGNSGLMVSSMGLGTNNFGSRVDEARTTAAVEKALELVAASGWRLDPAEIEQVAAL